MKYYKLYCDIFYENNTSEILTFIKCICYKVFQ